RRIDGVGFAVDVQCDHDRSPHSSREMVDLDPSDIGQSLPKGSVVRNSKIRVSMTAKGSRTAVPRTSAASQLRLNERTSTKTLVGRFSASGNLTGMRLERAAWSQAAGADVRISPHNEPSLLFRSTPPPRLRAQERLRGCLEVQ